MRLKPLAIDDKHPKPWLPSADPVLFDPLPDVFRGALGERGGLTSGQFIGLKQRARKMNVAL
jgi:hypothetical protein